MINTVLIENDFLQAIVSPAGAELKSLTLKRTNHQLIWQGDPKIWKDSSPWLFPIVGRLKNGFFSYKGRKYEPGMHGFARNCLFAAKVVNEHEVGFTLRDTPETLHLFPWPFELSIDYRLIEKSLAITVQVVNTGKEPMMFSLGAHPGFNASPGDRLIFEAVEQLPIYRLDPALDLLSLTADECLSGNELLLDKKLFIKDAIFLKGPRSQSIELIRSGAPCIRLRFPKVPYLGLWCKPSANVPYVCIEPWYGVDDSVNSNPDIAAKEGINTLAPGSAFSMDLRIEAC